MSPRRETSRALLLRSVDYGESDRIATLFTEDMGRISVLARSARKSWRRFGGALEPFSIFEVTFSPGKGRLYNLEESSLLAANIGLAKDLKRMDAGAFILELVREVVPEREPQREIFAIVEETLALLAEASGPAIGLIGTAAELKILSSAGIAVCVDRCNACGRQVPENKKVKFHPARGGVVCSACGGGPMTLSAAGISALAELSVKPLSEAVEVKIGEEDAAMLDRSLASFIEHHLDRPLRNTHLLVR